MADSKDIDFSSVSSSLFEQLKLEIQRERKLIEAAIAAQDEGGDE